MYSYGSRIYGRKPDFLELVAGDYVYDLSTVYRVRRHTSPSEVEIESVRDGSRESIDATIWQRRSFVQVPMYFAWKSLEEIHDTMKSLELSEMN